MIEKNRSLFPWIIVLILVAVILASCLSGKGNPTSTPVPIVSPRVVGDTNNFPWQESWRKKAYLLDEYQNVRNLVVLKDGGILMDYPPPHDKAWLKFFEVDDGSIRWRVDLEWVIDSIVADDNLVYVAGRAGKIVEAYDLQTGALAWHSNVALPDHRTYLLQLHDQHLYVYGSRNFTYVFNSKTGDLVDEIRVPDFAQRFLLYLGDDKWLLSEGERVMLAESGEIVWQTDLGGTPQKFPVICDNMLIVRFDDNKVVFGGLAGLDLMTGELVWQRPGEFYSNFVKNDDLLYVVSKEAKILVLDPRDGQTVGFAELLPQSVDIVHPISAIAVNENMLYVYFRDSRELVAFEKMGE